MTERHETVIRGEDPSQQIRHDPQAVRQTVLGLVAVVALQGVLALVFWLLHGGTHAGATLVFLLGAPAVAVLVPLRGLDLLAKSVIALATAVVVNAVVAEFMLATDRWSIDGAVQAVGTISIGLAIATCATSVRLIARPGGRRADPDAGHESADGS
ncbi:hypothetical protein [Pseudonocardia sp. H11422]|uniref:hypothetical protein n=1 Tax=Pseudonocardia sp. H11422 TaxID=2835866 RepID=UPI001BDD1FED|nr:hypothetical protein [Pseudonocardia sp. H11422]